MGLAGFLSNLYVTRTQPVSLVHFVTNRCNARCAFCFIDFDEPETFAGELSLEELRAVVRSVGPQLRNVNLTGGEPFLRRDLVDVGTLWMAQSSIRSMFVTSNGSFPERMVHFAKTLVRRFPKKSLTFSLSIDALGEEHNKIRKVPGLFERCLDSYRRLKQMGSPVMVNVAITISPDNYERAEAVYDGLIDDYGVKSISITLVRDEGVFVVPEAEEKALIETYRRLGQRVNEDLKSGRLEGYESRSMQGRMMNRKNRLSDAAVLATYEKDSYISRCHAAGLFGVLEADGTVKACEILPDTMGNVRDFNLDMMALWRSERARELYQHIGQTKCHCTYECAWTLNILGNWRYQPAMAKAALGLGKGTRGVTEKWMAGRDD